MAGLLTFVLVALASGHVILYKRDSRAAVAWVGLIWLVPVLGVLLYVLLGVNRIRRHADRRGLLPTERRAIPRRRIVPRRARRAGEEAPPPELPQSAEHLRTLAALVQEVAGQTLTPGNAVVPLVDGDAAYPAMLAAIAQARRSVALSTYIFGNDAAGREFADALEAAHHRGVAVRVLIDAAGARYSWPTSVRTLRGRRVPTAVFGRTLMPWHIPYMNLRNHRKLLVVDGCVGFTGGMNIRAGHRLALQPRHPVQDLHFRLDGPVVAHLMAAFADDWAFSTREVLSDDPWFPPLASAGTALARGLADGPDEDFEQARFTLLGALACARDSVRVVTPYFLPDASLLTALSVTAMRGVRVEILLPEVNNLKLVQWASVAQLWEVLIRGCRLYSIPPPFDHTKLMLVDGVWAFIGSSNWDPRSLRLNFEFDVECYDATLAAELDALVDAKLARARPITLADVDARSLPIRLRDGIARLFAPYL